MMNISESLKRGIIELMLLTLLTEEDMYGYQICQLLKSRSQGFFILEAGSLYPTLYRMQERGYISDQTRLVGKKRTRVYYHLEPKGVEYLNALRQEYFSLNRGAMFVLGLGDLEDFIHGNTPTK